MLLAVVTAREEWFNLFAAQGGRRILVDAARISFIKECSPSRPSEWLVTRHWRRDVCYGCASWFGRVASACSPTGGPSRMEFHRLDNMAQGKIKVLRMPYGVIALAVQGGENERGEQSSRQETLFSPRNEHLLCVLLKVVSGLV